MKKKMNCLKKTGMGLIAYGLMGLNFVYAQAGAGSAIEAAEGELRTEYLPAVSTLLMAIGGLIGLIGAINVYTAWNNGERDVNKKILSWGGSCVFLVLVSIVLKGFFGAW